MKHEPRTLSRARALTFASITWALPRPGEACEPLPCHPSDTLPRKDSTVPSNIESLRFNTFAGPLQPNDHEIQLLDSQDGSPVPLRLSEISSTSQGPQNDNSLTYKVELLEPLQEGHTYTWSTPNRCTPDQFEISKTKQPPSKLALTVGPSAPPVLHGHLELGHVNISALKRSTIWGSCFIEGTAAWGQINLILDSDVAWGPLVDVYYVVDDYTWTFSDDINNSPPLGGTFSGNLSELVYTPCKWWWHDNDDPDDGLPPGTHTISVYASIWGQTDWKKLDEITIETSCFWGVRLPGSTSGCSTSPSPKSPWLLLLVLIGYTTRRRRRATQTPPHAPCTAANTTAIVRTWRTVKS